MLAYTWMSSEPELYTMKSAELSPKKTPVSISVGELNPEISLLNLNSPELIMVAVLNLYEKPFSSLFPFNVLKPFVNTTVICSPE